MAVAIGIYGGRGGFTTLPASLLIFGGLMPLMTIGQLPTLAYYALSPRKLSLDEQAMIHGGKIYPYAEMISIGSYVSKAATQIRMVNGKQLLLRWDVWLGCEIWERILEAKTLPHLHRKACDALERGEKVGFGPGASLGQKTLSLREGDVAITAISSIRFVNESNMGAQRRILHVADERRELTVDEDQLCNQHVLLTLLAEKLAARDADETVSAEKS